MKVKVTNDDDLFDYFLNNSNIVLLLYCFYLRMNNRMEEIGESEGVREYSCNEAMCMKETERNEESLSNTHMPDFIHVFSLISSHEIKALSTLESLHICHIWDPSPCIEIIFYVIVIYNISFIWDGCTSVRLIPIRGVYTIITLSIVSLS